MGVGGMVVKQAMVEMVQLGGMLMDLRHQIISISNPQAKQSLQEMAGMRGVAGLGGLVEEEGILMDSFLKAEKLESLSKK